MSRLRALRLQLAKAGIDGFLLGLLLSVWVAYVLPGPGSLKGFWSFHTLADVGVGVIFFFYGLRLDPEKIRAGVGNWRLHMVVQLVTFVLFPLLAMAARGAFGGRGHADLWLGILYMSALPGTVSSAIVMISIAGGNITGGIFNASLASLIGIFITPLWMSYFLGSHGGSNEGLGHIIVMLIMQVLVPVVAGFLLHGKGGAFAARHGRQLRLFDQSVILLIVYNAFSESFTGNMFQGMSFGFLVELSALLLLVFLLFCAMVYGICRALRFDGPDTITAVFCGSKKSLVHGTVMGNVIFGGAANMGILMLPLMIYHALQLIAASIMAQAIAQRNASH